MRETLIIDLFMVLKFVFGMKFVVSSNTKQNNFMEKEHLLSYILINGRYLPPPEGQNQRKIESSNLTKSTNDTLTLKETFIIL